jgi:hypothetical protein
MKTQIMLAAALGLMLAGCSTVTSPTGVVTQTFDAQKTASVMRAVIPPAVQFADANAPQYAQYIVAAQVVTCGLVGSTNVTPTAIQTALNATGINEIKTPEIEGVTATVYGIYTAFYADLVTAHLPQSEIVTNTSIVLQAVCDSLTQGLGTNVAPVTVQPAAQSK